MQSISFQLTLMSRSRQESNLHDEGVSTNCHLPHYLNGKISKSHKEGTQFYFLRPQTQAQEDPHHDHQPPLALSEASRRVQSLGVFLHHFPPSLSPPPPTPSQPFPDYRRTPIYLCGEVLQDGCAVHSGSRAHTSMASRPRFQVSMNTAHRELQTGSLRAGNRLCLGLSGVLPSLTASHFEFCCSSNKQGRERTSQTPSENPPPTPSSHRDSNCAVSRLPRSLYTAECSLIRELGLLIPPMAATRPRDASLKLQPMRRRRKGRRGGRFTARIPIGACGRRWGRAEGLELGRRRAQRREGRNRASYAAGARGPPRAR